MCYHFLLLVYFPLNQLNVIYLCFLSVGRETSTFHNLEKKKNVLCLLHFLDSNTSMCHVKTISPDWTCALKYQVTCRLLCGCTVRRPYHVSHPSNSTLWRKQTQLLLAIDTFVVPLCWTAIVCCHGPQLPPLHCLDSSLPCLCAYPVSESCVWLISRDCVIWKVHSDVGSMSIITLFA